MRSQARWTAGFVVAVAAAGFARSAHAHFGEQPLGVLPEADHGTPTPGGEGGTETGSEPPVQLFPRLELARSAGWFLPPEPAPDNPEERAEATLEVWMDDALGRDRIEAGGVDGWYFEMEREMRQAFRPDQGAAESERRAGMTPIQVVFDELQRYASGIEAPRGPGLNPEMRGAVTDPGDRRQVVEQEVFDVCNPLNAPTTWYRVDLRVTHGVEGNLAASWVLRSSGIRSLDEAALHAVRTGALHLPAPPMSMVGERHAVRSDWAFEMGDVATLLSCPTMSGAAVGTGCVDDPVLGTMCSFAGRGIIRTRVWLLAVVDATHFTAAERRSERRERHRESRVRTGHPDPERLIRRPGVPLMRP